MDQGVVFLIITGMMLVTYLPRLLPAWALSSRRLPLPVERWLKHVPPAVLAALLGPALLSPEGTLSFNPANAFLWAGIASFFVAWRFKSFFGAIAVGMGLVALARFMF